MRPSNRTPASISSVFPSGVTIRAGIPYAHVDRRHSITPRRSEDAPDPGQSTARWLRSAAIRSSPAPILGPATSPLPKINVAITTHDSGVASASQPSAIHRVANRPRNRRKPNCKSSPEFAPANGKCTRVHRRHGGWHQGFRHGTTSRFGRNAEAFAR